MHAPMLTYSSGIGELASHYDFIADHWFETSEVCAEQIESLLQPNDFILIKGSSSARTKKVMEKLREIAEIDSSKTLG